MYLQTKEQQTKEYMQTKDSGKSNCDLTFLLKKKIYIYIIQKYPRNNEAVSSL